MNRKMNFILIGTLLLSCCFVCAPLEAAQYNIKEMTPEVEQALVNRRDRYDELSSLKEQGMIGENNKGYVELLGGDTNEMRVVDAENMDRKVIYETIAEQNGLQGALNTIEKVFAQVQRDKAQSGEKIQMPDGSWKTK